MFREKKNSTNFRISLIPIKTRRRIVCILHILILLTYLAFRVLQRSSRRSIPIHRLQRRSFELFRGHRHSTSVFRRSGSNRKRFQVSTKHAASHSSLTIFTSFCSSPKLTNSQQVYLFFKQLAAIIGNQVKYGTNDTIGMMCQHLCIPCIVDDYTRLVNYVNSSFGTDCFPTYTDVISNLKNTNTDNRKMGKWDFGDVFWSKMFSIAARQWMYQMCTQIGNFETSTTSVFSRKIPVDFYYRICGDTFPLGYVLKFVLNLI